MSNRKNVIFLMTDQHRLDHVSYADASKMATPNLDRIAESVAFVNCTTVNPICTPARVALLTGKYSHQVGMLGMSGNVSPQHPTYLRALQQAGYWTAAVGKLHWFQGWPWHTPRGMGHNLVAMKEQIKSLFGLDYLWEAAGKQLAVKNYCDYFAYLDQKGLLDAYRDHVQAEGPNSQDPGKTQFSGNPWPLDEQHYVDNVIGAEAMAALDLRPSDQPFSMFVSFCGPHKPYDPPQSALERFTLEEKDDFIAGPESLSDAVKQRLYRLRRAYKAMIWTIDHQVGLLLAKLQKENLLDSTVILLTSDHGEMMGDHGRMSKMQPWRQSISVPTAIRHPEYLHRRTCAAPVEITDLTATMLDIAGLDPQAALSKAWPMFNDRVPCRSLMPIVTGKADRVRDFSFAECNGQWQLIQDERWKYIRCLQYKTPGSRTEQFYDRQADPDELHNRIDDAPLRAEIDAFRARCDFVMDSTPPAQLGWAPIGS